MQQNVCYNCFKEKGNNSVCPHCGYSFEQDGEKYPLALPPGTVLGGKYIVGRVLGQGGFGITYVAQDYKSKQLVAIKEYFPETLATRNASYSVSSYSKEKEDGFRYGKECFLDEAKTLAEFIGNLNIVRVYSYFEENGTAYFVMEYIDGISLKNYLNNNGGKISFEEAERILLPIMEATSAVHAKGIIHRDISPDNIFLTNDGSVKLIDFGAARYSLGDKSQSLDIILKHGYAPKEQYTRNSRQGPYTDVYSLAATFYKAITGHIPPNSIERIEEDSLVMPSALCSDIPPEAENALLKGLAVMVTDRFQDMQSFKEALTFVKHRNTGVINGYMERKTVIEKHRQTAESKKFNIKYPIILLKKKTEEKNINKNIAAKKKADIYCSTLTKELPKKREKKFFKNVFIKIIPCAAVIAVVIIIIFTVLIKPNTSDISVSAENNTESYFLDENGNKEIFINEDSNNNFLQNNSNKTDLSQDNIGSFNFSEKEFTISEYGSGVQITGYSGNATDLTIPSKIFEKPVIAIGDFVFRYSQNLTSVTIPDSVRLIGESAFRDCNNLKKVSIPKNCQVSDNAFDGCDNVIIERR